MLKGLDFDLQHSIYVKVVNIDIGSSSLTFYIDIIGPLQSYTIYIIRAVKISIMEVFDRVRDGLSRVHRGQVYVLWHVINLQHIPLPYGWSVITSEVMIFEWGNYMRIWYLIFIFLTSHGRCLTPIDITYDIPLQSAIILTIYLSASKYLYSNDVLIGTMDMY